MDRPRRDGRWRRSGGSPLTVDADRRQRHETLRDEARTDAGPLFEQPIVVGLHAGELQLAIFDAAEILPADAGHRRIENCVSMPAASIAFKRSRDRKPSLARRPSGFGFAVRGAITAPQSATPSMAICRPSMSHRSLPSAFFATWGMRSPHLAADKRLVHTSGMFLDMFVDTDELLVAINDDFELQYNWQLNRGVQTKGRNHVVPMPVFTA